MKKVSVQLPEEVIEVLRIQAQAEMSSISQVVRKLVVNSTKESV